MLNPDVFKVRSDELQQQNTGRYYFGLILLGRTCLIVSHEPIVLIFRLAAKTIQIAESGNF